MTTLIDLANVPGLTVTHMEGSAKLDVLINATGQWFEVIIPPGDSNLLVDMGVDSQHWILYGSGKANILRIECPADDFIPLTREFIKLVRETEESKVVSVIPVSVMEINTTRTLAKVYAPFKAETWLLKSFPDENWRLHVDILKD